MPRRERRLLSEAIEACWLVVKLDTAWQVAERWGQKENAAWLHKVREWAKKRADKAIAAHQRCGKPVSGEKGE